MKANEEPKAGRNLQPAICDLQPATCNPPARPLVLVVDDDPDFATTLADVLETRGYRTDSRNSAQEALSSLERELPDLALVDLRLPDINGIELLRLIKERSPETAVVILTGHGNIDAAVRAVKLGACGFLEKPYRIEKLFLIIERALVRPIRATENGLWADGCRLVESTRVAFDFGRFFSRSRLPCLAFELDTGRAVETSPAMRRLLDSALGIEQPAAGHQSSEFGVQRLFVESTLHRRTDRSASGSGDPIREDASFAAHLADLKENGSAHCEVVLPSRPGDDDACPGGPFARRYHLVSFLDTQDGNLALSFLIDATASWEREERNARARQYFEAIFENLAAGVMVVDSSFVIQHVNPAFARFFDAAPQQLLKRRCHEVIHRHSTPCHLHGEVCPIKICLATGATVRVQHRHLDTEGRPHFIENTMTPLRDESGMIVSFVAILADFTDIKLAHEESEAKSRRLSELNRELTGKQEQIAAQAEELKKANVELLRLGAAKDDFVSMVSHELRTPLTAISEGINLVADGTLGSIQPQQSRFLELALNNTRRLADLINDLLDLSKIESGRFDLRPMSLNIAELLAETAATYEAAARQKNLELRLGPDTCPARVYADERMVRRTLNNLLSNALKFTDQGSITISSQRRNGRALVRVKDTGIGIPESERNLVFQKFCQIQHHDGRRPPGTGLGLVLTREMVAMNGGEIWFESNEGKGTEFCFTIPLDNASSRIAALLFRHGFGAGRGSVDPTQGAQLSSELLFITVGNVRELHAAHGPDGVRAALEAVEQRIVEGQVSYAACQVLPDAEGILLLLTGEPDRIAAQRQRVSSVLCGATFIVRNKVVRIELCLAGAPLSGPADPTGLLAGLRRNLARIN